LGVRAIVLGFRVRVRVRVRIRIRGLGDQNYEVGFETIGTVTQNYANFDYSGYFSICSFLLCAVSHSMDAMSLPYHLLQVCVQGVGVGQEREPSTLQLAFPAPQTRFLTH